MAKRHDEATEAIKRKQSAVGQRVFRKRNTWAVGHSRALVTGDLFSPNGNSSNVSRSRPERQRTKEVMPNKN
jgi:hypothetical protein